ncbi:MAG: TlpA disulfide reductase family protein [Neisseria sp.]|nr:TlpA disulfide reductase family protein [Neisseria sp.]
MMSKFFSRFIVFSALLASSSLTFANDLSVFPNGKTASLNEWKTPIRIVNIWATWCKPCRKEMPEMSAWYQKQNKKQVELIGIAIDREENISKFLKESPVRYPIWRYTGKDSRAFLNALGNKIGAYPYTLVEKRGCSFKHTITGEVNGKKLDEAVQLVQKQCK